MTVGHLSLLDEEALRQVIREEAERLLSEVRRQLERLHRDTKGPAHDEALLTAAEVSQRLAVDRRTLRRMDREGAIPSPLRIGERSIRWSRRTLDAWIENGCPPRE